MDDVQGYPNRLKFTVTSDYPISSPVTITYSARGEFYLHIFDESGSVSEPQSFESRDWTKTLTVGQSRWEFTFVPDEYGTLDPGLPGSASIASAEGFISLSEFSDNEFHYVEGNTFAEL